MGTSLTPAEAALQENRAAAHQEIMARPGTDLADLSEREFTGGLERIRIVQQRMETILATALTKDRHFGNPNKAFASPILYKAGAEEIRRLMKVRVRRIAEPNIIATDEWVSVTVHLGIFDQMGRIIAERSANCNTKEARFRARNGGWTYRDPREMVHQCLAMADKRAASDLTEEASGATGYFQTEAALMAGIEEGAVEVGCSAEDKSRIVEAARLKGLVRRELFALIGRATGREMAPGEGEPFVTRDEVAVVLDLIDKWRKPGPIPTETVRGAGSADSPQAPSDWLDDEPAEVPSA